MVLILTDTLKKQINLNLNFQATSYLRKKIKKIHSDTEERPEVVNKEAIA